MEGVDVHTRLVSKSLLGTGEEDVEKIGFLSLVLLLDYV